MPFLAFAFTSKTYTETEEELLILVTPHLVDPMACNQIPKYLPGRETRTPDDFELFLEGILEAPRGQRNLTHPYTAAYLNGPTCAASTPCGDMSGCAAVAVPRRLLDRRPEWHCAAGSAAARSCSGPIEHEGRRQEPRLSPADAPGNVQTVGTGAAVPAVTGDRAPRADCLPLSAGDQQPGTVAAAAQRHLVPQ